MVRVDWPGVRGVLLKLALSLPLAYLLFKIGGGRQEPPGFWTECLPGAFCVGWIVAWVSTATAAAMGDEKSRSHGVLTPFLAIAYLSAVLVLWVESGAK